MTHNAPRIIPAITPTFDQWEIIDTISDPFVKEADDGYLRVYEVKDDNHIALYTIAPNGEYFTEELLSGFNGGWTALDPKGRPLDI